MNSDYYEAASYLTARNHGFRDGYQEAKDSLAKTLTRLRATVKDLDSEDDRAYVRALEHVASAFNLTTETVTTVTVTYVPE